MWIAAWAAAGWAPVACSPDAAPEGGSFSVRDSAGVRVVENAGPAWEGGEAWLVEAEPVLSLGVLEGPEELRFFQIQDVALRDDGTILVADGGSQEVRAFDPSGSPLWRQGGEGDGPGEYRGISALLLRPGDSVAVYDLRARRVTVLDPDGEVARSFVPEVPEGRSMAAPRIAVTPDRWVSSGGVRFTGEGAGSETVSPPTTYLWARPDGAVLGEAAELPTESRLIQREGGSVGFWTIPFSEGAAVTGGRGRMITGDPAEPRWTARDTLGRVVQAVAFPAERRAVTDEDWARAEETSLGEDPDAARRRMIADAYDEMDRPASWPFFQDIRLDDTGAVWVEAFQAPWADSEPHRWWVFDEDGRLLGEISTPAGLDVRVIAGDRLVGVATDEVGVERVRVHRIRKP